MASGVFYANNSESVGLYGNTVYFGATYFEWMVFKTSATTPATPTGGSWNFTTNSGTAPSGWTVLPPTNTSYEVWVSFAIVDSNNPTSLTWSVPGVFTPPAQANFVFATSATGSGILPSGTTAQRDVSPAAGYFRANSTTNKFEGYINGAWVTFSSAASGILPVTDGGTGASDAATARTNLAITPANIGAATSGANNNITSLSGLTTALSVGQGGTGATAGPAALVNLGERTSATGSIALPVGTTAQRDASPATGYLRTNSSTSNSLEWWNGSSWVSIPATGLAASGANSDITSLSALASVPTVISQYAQQIKGISASVATNALTISSSALSLDFRSATLGSGVVTTVSGTPANLVVPASATLGTVNAIQSRLVVIALNNSGTIELAVVNISGGNDLTETGLISTTAISSGSTAANVIYSTTARTNVAYRVIGYVESTQATAGTWATAPSTVQGVGGQALAAMSSLGYGQTWQNVTGSRAASTTYWNTTGKPIQIVISAAASTGAVWNFNLVINGVTMPQGGATSSNPAWAQISAIAPPGASYSLSASNVTIQPTNGWLELR